MDDAVNEKDISVATRDWKLLLSIEYVLRIYARCYGTEKIPFSA